jgi:endonuclease/exonuclease/phosphatase family metal-dependent hydrolase
METGKIRLLIYNTHLMEDSNIVVGAWYKNKKPVVFQDEARHPFIVQKIKDSGADIVALQEVWAAKRMERFQRELSDKYPYCALGSGGATPLKYLPELLNTGIPPRASGSGLVVLSKLPLSDVLFELFDDPDDDEERAASKGTLTVTVQGPTPFRLGVTHAWTNAGGDDCRNISDLIGRTTRIPLAAVMAGDLNIHRSSSKYGKLDKMMKDAGAQDSWRQVHGDNKFDESVTDNERRNNLAQFFSPMRDTAKPDCIDYVYAGSTPQMTIKAGSAEVLRDWKFQTDRPPNWYWVHPLSTLGSPAATGFGPNEEKLCAVARTAAGNLLAAVCDGETNSWTHRVIQSEGKDVHAVGAPGLMHWGGVLHLFFSQGAEVLKMESRDGLEWTRPENQGFRSSGGICAVVYQDTPHVFVRDGGGGNQVSFYNFANGWKGPNWIGVETDHDISATVMGKSMWVVTKAPGGRTGGIMHSRVDGVGKDWLRNVQIAPHAETAGSPGIVAYQGNFYVFYRNTTGEGIMYRTSGNGWTKEEGVGVDTTDQVTPVVWKHKVMLFFPYVVNDSWKGLPEGSWTSLVEKVLHPEGALMYPSRAFAHCYWPIPVTLDASDHYPYMVDLELTPNK